MFLTIISCFQKYDDPLDKMGFHWYGTIASLLLPTFLTMVFYAGTLIMIYLDGSYEMLFSKNQFHTCILMIKHLGAKEWKKAMNNIQWIRHIIMVRFSIVYSGFFKKFMDSESYRI